MDHNAMEDEDIDVQLERLHNEAYPKRVKKKRDAAALRKAPQAPKRFKSSYICFFMAKQTAIKEELGEKATVTAISKRSAEMWKHLPTHERTHWDDIAAKDKQRYMIEKASYTGPWQVPWKRAKKDPSAPKRPMSAFLYFSQGKRAQIKKENPDLKNTEVSRLLGSMWRNAPPEDRQPHVDKELGERKKYHVAIAAWRLEDEAKQEVQRKAQAEQVALTANMQLTMQGHEQVVGAPSMPYSDQYGALPPPPPGPPGYMYPGYPYVNYYPLPTNGKQPVVLGPSGTPHYQGSYGSQQPGAAGPPAPPGAYPPGQQPFEEGQGEAHFEYATEQGEPQTAE